jgi:mannosyltransferase
MKKTVDVIVAILAKYWIIVAVFAAIITLLISMYESIGQSVWFDEGYSIMLAQRPVHELVALTSVDAHPPLYYLFLKLWGSVFGWSELALRLSSAIAGAVSVGLMVVLIRKLFSPKIAVVVAPFLVLAPFLARYNYEIRMYALISCIGILATLVLVMAYRTRATKWWVLYALLVAMGMYTLYMSAVIWLAHVVWLAYEDHRHHRPIIRQRHWAYYCWAVILFIPWLPTVINQVFNSALPPFMTAMTLDQAVNIITMLLGYNASWQTGAWLSVGLMIIGLLLVYLLGKVWRASGSRYRQGIVLVGLGFVTGIIFYTLTSLPPIPPHFMERYTLHIALFFYAIIGIVVALGWRIGYYKQSAVLGALTVFVMGYGLFTLHDVGNYNFQRLQFVQAKTIRSDIGCDQTTFVTAGPYGYIDMWYDFQGCDLRFYQPDDVVFSGGFAPVNDSAQRIKNSNGLDAKRVVFVYFDDSTVSMTPDSRYTQVGQQDFNKTHVKIYER